MVIAAACGKRKIVVAGMSLQVSMKANWPSSISATRR